MQVARPLHSFTAHVGTTALGCPAGQSPAARHPRNHGLTTTAAGHVRRLSGQLIEIHGNVKLYDGSPENILSRVGHLPSGSTMIPPLLKN